MQLRAVVLVVAVAGTGVAACGGQVAPEQAPEDLRPSQRAPEAPAASNGRKLPEAPRGSEPPRLTADVSYCGSYELPHREVLTAFGESGYVGLFRISRVDGECSGMGGTHATFTFVSGCVAPSASVHMGGHGCYAEAKVDELVVAAWDRTTGAWEDEGFCVGDLPDYAGTARAWERVPSLQEGTKLLVELGCVP